MKPSRVVALILGTLFLIPGLGLLVSGGALGLGYAVHREDGYLTVDVDDISSPTAAITAEQLDLANEPGTPDWVIDALEADVRLRVSPVVLTDQLFVGVARQEAIDGYLNNVARDRITSIDDLDASYERIPGTSSASPPQSVDIWEASATGEGVQQIDWESSEGEWGVVVMNRDGSADIAANLSVGVASDAFVAAIVGLIVVGFGITALGISLIVVGSRGRPRQPETVMATGPTASRVPPASPVYPLALRAELDPNLSSWKWLVKWFLAIPHLIYGAFLFIAFAVVTLLAGISILFTGRYPRGLFDFNVGVLRWSWRVSYYAFSGGLGSDRYPSFSLAPQADDLTELTVEYPARLSRVLVLFKWWLLALPHYVIVAVLAGGGLSWDYDNWSLGWGIGGGGLVGLLALVAGVILLVKGSYPLRLFDLIIGINRWVYRVAAYSALMTDEYPPFRLDQGGEEPTGADKGGYPTPPPPFEPSPVDLHDDRLDHDDRQLSTPGFGQ